MQVFSTIIENVLNIAKAHELRLVEYLNDWPGNSFNTHKTEPYNLGTTGHLVFSGPNDPARIAAFESACGFPVTGKTTEGPWIKVEVHVF